MASASTPARATTPAPTPATQPEHAPPQPKTRWPWLKYATPALVLVLAAAVAVTITRDWNAWEGGRIEQETDDAFVRGDLTPLSTKVAGIVRNVKVTDFQKVRAGDLLVELQDDDYQAQLAQARAAVEAGKEAVQADVVRTRAERARQEALLATHATTQQRVEGAIADEQRLAAQAASRDADLEQARTALRS